MGRRLKRRGTWPGIAARLQTNTTMPPHVDTRQPHTARVSEVLQLSAEGHLAKQCPNALYCEGVVSDGVVGKGCVVKQGVVSEGVW